MRDPIVLERDVKGTVKWFSMMKGYGFIRLNDEEKEIFVHASSIVRSINKPLVLMDGQKVEFDIIDGIKGHEAACVSGPNGMRVGKTFDADRLPNNGRFYYGSPRNALNGPPRRRLRDNNSQPKEGEQQHGQKESTGKAVKDVEGKEAKKDNNVEAKGNQHPQQEKEAGGGQKPKGGGGRKRIHYRHRPNNNKGKPNKDDAGKENTQPKDEEEVKELKEVKTSEEDNNEKKADEPKETEEQDGNGEAKEEETEEEEDTEEKTSEDGKKTEEVTTD